MRAEFKYSSVRMKSSVEAGEAMQDDFIEKTVELGTRIWLLIVDW